MTQDKYAIGQEKLNQILGEETAKNVSNSLNDLHPELSSLVTEFVYGHLYKSESLDLKTRQLCTIAALTVMGKYKPHLKTHIAGALRVGATKKEILEVMIQMIAYAGFPAATTALVAAKDIFENNH